MLRSCLTTTLFAYLLLTACGSFDVETDRTASFIGTPGCPDCVAGQHCEVTSGAEKLSISGDPLDLPPLASALVHVSSGATTCERSFDPSKITRLPSETPWLEVLAPCEVAEPTMIQLRVITQTELLKTFDCAYLDQT